MRVWRLREKHDRHPVNTHARSVVRQAVRGSVEGRKGATCYYDRLRWLRWRRIPRAFCHGRSRRIYTRIILREERDDAAPGSFQKLTPMAVTSFSYYSRPCRLDGLTCELVVVNVGEPQARDVPQLLRDCTCCEERELYIRRRSIRWQKVRQAEAFGSANQVGGNHHKRREINTSTTHGMTTTRVCPRLEKIVGDGASGIFEYLY